MLDETSSNREAVEYFASRTWGATIEDDRYWDKTLLEDNHSAHKNPFAMTISRSMILNILHLNKTKSINEQIIRNRWDLDDSIAQLLRFSF